MFAVTAGREGTHAGLAEPRPDCIHDTGLVPNHHLATAAVGLPGPAVSPSRFASFIKQALVLQP